MLASTSPYPVYSDLDGRPLDAGSLYFGEAGEEPTTNPIVMYWDAAGTQPAAQPVRTVNGYAARAGTPALLYAPGDYSLLVRNSKGQHVVYAPSSYDFGNQAAIVAFDAQIRADLAAPTGATLIGHGDETVETALDALEGKIDDTRSLAGSYLIRDVVAASANDRWQLTRIGVSAGNVVQGFALDEANRYVYTHHVSGSYTPGTEVGIINRYRSTGPKQQTAIDSSTPSSDLGHQGLAVEYRNNSSGDVRLWTSANTDTQSQSCAWAVRFEYVPGGLPINIEKYRLFAGTAGGSSTPCISDCGRWLVAKYNTYVELGAEPGSYKVRVFALRDLLAGGAGDYSVDKHVYEFDMTLAQISAPVGIQGLACDGAFIYVLCGPSDPAAQTTIAVFTLTGEFIRSATNVVIGKADSAATGDGGLHEPECLSFGSVAGRRQLMIGIASGSSGARVFRVYGTQMNAPVHSAPGNGSPAFFSQSAIDMAWPPGDDYTEGPFDGATFTQRRVIKPDGREYLDVDPGATSARFTRRTDTGFHHVLQRGGVSYGGTYASTAHFQLVALGGADVLLSYAGTEADTPTGALRIVSADGTVEPNFAGTQNLGSSGRRWKEVFATLGAINTSDARLKGLRDGTPVGADFKVSPLTSTELAAAKDLAAEVGIYTMLDSINNTPRWHTGLTVQRAMQILTAHGLTPTAYSFICYDSKPEERRPITQNVWVREERVQMGETESGEGVYQVTQVYEDQPVLGPDGDVLTEVVREAVDAYGFRTEELLHFLLRAGFQLGLQQQIVIDGILDDMATLMGEVVALRAIVSP